MITTNAPPPIAPKMASDKEDEVSVVIVELGLDEETVAVAETDE